jgi:hypothetical protein
VRVSGDRSFFMVSGSFGVFEQDRQRVPAAVVAERAGRGAARLTAMISRILSRTRLCSRYACRMASGGNTGRRRFVLCCAGIAADWTPGGRARLRRALEETERS